MTGLRIVAPPGYDEITEEERAEVTAAHPRPNFKREILKAFTQEMAHRPDSTFGHRERRCADPVPAGQTRGELRRDRPEFQVERVTDRARLRARRLTMRAEAVEDDVQGAVADLAVGALGGL